jgi:hypothetical protein
MEFQHGVVSLIALKYINSLIRLVFRDDSRSNVQPSQPAFRQIPSTSPGLAAGQHAAGQHDVFRKDFLSAICVTMPLRGTWLREVFRCWYFSVSCRTTDVSPFWRTDKTAQRGSDGRAFEIAILKVPVLQVPVLQVPVLHVTSLAQDQAVTAV